MVTLSAVIQAPVQALLRPSMWIPFYKRLHSHTEIWNVDLNMTDFLAAILSAIKSVTGQDDNTESYDIHKVNKDTGFVRVFAFTRAEWLDVIEIQDCKDGLYEIRSFSSGLFPLCIPFACIINLTMFWVPFLDNDFNQKRVKRIRDALNITVTVNS